MSGILGVKVGMSQVFTPEGERIAVTLVSTEGCSVVQMKTAEKEGYNAIQIGVGKKSVHKINQPLRKHFEKAKLKPTRWLREVHVEDVTKYTAGQLLSLDFLKPGDVVQVRGVTKGRGFTGVMKRWNFSGGPAAHGSCFHRRVGSIGNHTFPKHVFKRRRMPGHYGCDQLSVKNEVVEVLKDQNLLVLKGSVPGSNHGLLEIRKK